MNSGAAQIFYVGGGKISFMASAVARAYMAVCTQCPQWGTGAKPLDIWSGGLHPQKLKLFVHENTNFSP